MDGFQRLAKKKWMATLCQFFDSAIFPLFLAAASLLFYIINLPLATLALCAVCGCFICMFAKDSRPTLPILLFALITLRYKDNGAAYLSKGAISIYAFIGPFLLFAAFYRLFKRKVACSDKFGWGMVALFAFIMVFGGLFSPYYNWKNFFGTIGLACSLFLVYTFYSFTLEKRSDNLLYFARLAAIAVVVISLEIAEFYLRKYEWGVPLDSSWKDQIILGWSISNMVAEMIAFLLPAVFYLIYKEKYGYWYWLIVIFGCIAVYFTFARNALLWSAFGVVIGAIVNCFIGQHKKISRVITVLGICLVLGAFVALYMLGYFEKIAKFFLTAKFNNRGRFRVWGQYLRLFTEQPIFGVGFQAFNIINPGTIYNAHNNLLQMLSSAGLIGFFIYLIHRAQTVYMILKDPTPDRLFVGGCLLIAVLMSILSSTFFHTYFLIYYAVLLVVLEKSAKAEMK